MGSLYDNGLQLQSSKRASLPPLALSTAPQANFPKVVSRKGIQVTRPQVGFPAAELVLEKGAKEAVPPILAVGCPVFWSHPPPHVSLSICVAVFSCTSGRTNTLCPGPAKPACGAVCLNAPEPTHTCAWAVM